MILNTKNTVQLAGVVMAVVSCVGMPGDKAPAAFGGMGIPGGYRGGQGAVPELVGSLGAVFGGGEMRRQMELALGRNADLEEAAARLEEAGFQTRSARAGLFPSVDFGVGGNRSKTNSAGGAVDFGSAITERYSSSLDVQWEVDVWGRVRAGVLAADARGEVAKAEYEAARQSVAAQAGQAWLDLVAATRLRDLAKERLASFEGTVKLVERRFELGTADLGELSLAKTDVENARAEIGGREDARDRAARQLAVLTGGYPDGNLRASQWPSMKGSVAAGLPSTLLELRPDIFAAYMRIVAADADVKVAHRDLFPSFVLTGSGGSQSAALKKLADSNFSVWSIAADLSGPIVDGGRRRAELGAANARAKQALASYRSTVLNAFREVEDALGSEVYLRRQEEATASALAAARMAEEQTLRSFESGLVEVLTLLEAKRRRFAAEENLIGLKLQRYQNRVALALALGKAY